jgi:zinc protease
MRVLIEPSFALPLVTISVVFRSGVTSDPIGKEGLARIAARMVRRGGAGLRAHEVEEAIDELGGEFGSEVGYGWTAFSMEVIGRNVDAFVDLMSRLLASPSFDQDELSRLLREAEGEIVEARDNDRALAGRAFRRALFAGHPLSRRASGSLASLRTITRDDVVGHYTKTVCRSHALVALAGPLSEERARGLAERLLAGLPEGAPSPIELPEPAVKPGRHLVFVDKPERTQTQMYIGSLGTRPDDPDHTAFLVGNTVLGGTFTARLMREVRSARGWSYGAYSRLGVDRHREAFSLWTAPAAGDAPPCLALELELLDTWRRDGVTPEELAFTQSYMGHSYVFEIDTAQKRLQQRVDADLISLPSDYHSGYVERVRAVTLDQVNQAIQRRIDPANLVITVVGTYSEIGDKIVAAIPGLSGTQIVPFDAELPA